MLAPFPTLPVVRTWPCRPLMFAHPARRAPFVFALAAIFTLACTQPANDHASSAPNPVVGAWLVKDPNAPFPYHLYVFNADGTMQQANPDAGDPRTSDSDGKGAWIANGDTINGKWMEVAADRTTHQYTGRLEISVHIRVIGDSLSATESVRVFDQNDKELSPPSTPSLLTGRRIKP